MFIPHRFVNEARSEDKLLDLNDLLHDYIRLNRGTRLRVVPHEVPLDIPLYAYTDTVFKVNPPSYDSHKTLCTPPLKQTLPSPSIPATPKIFSNEKSQVSEASPLTKVVKEQTVKKPME